MAPGGGVEGGVKPSVGVPGWGRVSVGKRDIIKIVRRLYNKNDIVHV